MERGYTTRTTCRVCGGADLEPVFRLGNHYVNDFVAPGKAYEGLRCPIELVWCNQCTLVQNPYTAPQELLYTGHYWYKSGTTATMRDALADVVDCAVQRVSLKAGDVVLDIGSNDGTLLRSYFGKHLIKVGVEPAKNLIEEGRIGVDVFINDFWSAKTYNWHVAEKVTSQIYPTAKIITALGMFYDLDDPNQFIADIKTTLHPDGVFIAQLMYLHNMIEAVDIGNLAHEHLEFYTLKSLQALFARHGLCIEDIETNTVNGQSYRLYVRHQSQARMTQRTERAFSQENNIKERLKKFVLELHLNKQRVFEFISEEVNKRFRKVWVYGASTKGNTLLQWYGLDDWLIAGAAEKDPSKWGKVTIGTNIPITSEETARAVRPDYFLVLPYAFIDEFVKREEEQEWRKAGGKFIVPLPELKVI